MRIVVAFLPLLVAASSAIALAWTGLSRRDLAGTALEDFSYGFFLDRYPLLFFAAVYGAARIVAGSLGPPSRGGWLRLLTIPAGLLLFLVACFYPTFGGVVLRAGFSAGGQVFLTNHPLPVAYALGAGAAAAVYGLMLGGGLALARLRLGLSRYGVLRSLASFLALWWGAAVLGAPAIVGFDAVAEGWPAAPLGLPQALALAVVVATATLPHAVVVALARPAGSGIDRSDSEGSGRPGRPGL